MSKQLEKIKQLIEKREQARLGGGEKAIQKQHEKGKYTQVHSPRAYRDAARQGLIRGVRHVQGASLLQLRYGEEKLLGRRCRSR